MSNEKKTLYLQIIILVFLIFEGIMFFKLFSYNDCQIIDTEMKILKNTSFRGYKWEIFSSKHAWRNNKKGMQLFFEFKC